MLKITKSKWRGKLMFQLQFHTSIEFAVMLIH